MRLNEFYNPEEDRTVVQADDTRKARLTLRALNKLRRYRDIKQEEEEDRDNKIRNMYANPVEQGGL